MKWLLRLYPARWRERYGAEFGDVLSSQRASFGLMLDVVAGAIDAHLHPQIAPSQSNPTSNSNPIPSPIPNSIQGDEVMTLAMFQRCAAGGPKLSPEERKFASRFAILSSLALAIVYLALTKLYREAPAVQAVIYASIFFTSSIKVQMAYLRNHSARARALILGAELSAMYLFMLGVCLLASKI